jgi:hypothetical protein
MLFPTLSVLSEFQVIIYICKLSLKKNKITGILSSFAEFGTHCQLVCVKFLANNTIGCACTLLEFRHVECYLQTLRYKSNFRKALFNCP